MMLKVEILIMNPKTKPRRGYIYKGELHCTCYSLVYNHG